MLAALWRLVMVKGSQHNIVANESAVSNRNAALVLKVAARFSIVS